MTEMTLQQALSCATLPVPVAGRVFYNLGRNASYDAANRGDIPTVEIGGRKKAIVAPIAEKLGLRQTSGKAAA